MHGGDAVPEFGLNAREKMKRVGIGQAIQVAANMGVIAGIVFLALEIRQNSDLLSSQARFNNIQNQMSFAAMLVADGELTELIARAMQGAEISAGEQLRLRQMLILMLGTWEYEYREFEDGRLSRDDLRVESKRQDYGLVPRLAPGLWEDFRVGAYAPFVEFLEAEIQ